MPQRAHRRFFTAGAFATAALPLLLAGCVSPPTAGLSPDGSQIAIARGGNASLVLADSEGRQTAALDATRGAHDPVWSPRGDALLFLQAGEPEGDSPAPERITAYDLAQRRVIPLAEGAGTPLSWSPDGRHFLAFAAVDEDAGAEEQESGSRVEARWYRYPEGDVESRARLPLLSVPDGIPPVWLSPEGKVAIVGNTGEGQDLWIVSPQGARPVTTTHDVLGAGMAPDGSALLWARVQESAPGIGLSVWGLSRADGSVRRWGTPRLVPAPHGDGARPHQACFSPDGRSLGIVVSTDHGPEAYVGALSAKALRRVITARKPHRTDPDTAPDPGSLSFTWSRSGSRLAVVPSDPSQPLRLFGPGGNDRRGISIAPATDEAE